jgi:hypothetical protein
MVSRRSRGAHVRSPGQSTPAWGWQPEDRGRRGLARYGERPSSAPSRCGVSDAVRISRHITGELTGRLRRSMARGQLCDDRPLSGANPAAPSRPSSGSRSWNPPGPVPDGPGAPARAVLSLYPRSGREGPGPSELPEHAPNLEPWSAHRPAQVPSPTRSPGTFMAPHGARRAAWSATRALTEPAGLGPKGEGADLPADSEQKPPGTSQARHRPAHGLLHPGWLPLQGKA